MKKILISFFVLISFYTTGRAQEEVKTLLGDGVKKIGFYINPTFQTGKIGGQIALIPGARAGIVINHNFYAGLTYNQIINEYTPVNETDIDKYLDMRWGGLLLEYSLKPENMIHVNIPLTIGLGEVELDWKDGSEQMSDTPYGDRAFFTAAPGIQLEMNVSKYIKLSIGAEYRFVNKVTFRNLTEKELRGFTAMFGIKAGIF
jgi:hypothetical protein